MNVFHSFTNVKCYCYTNYKINRKFKNSRGKNTLKIFHSFKIKALECMNFACCTVSIKSLFKMMICQIFNKELNKPLEYRDYNYRTIMNYTQPNHTYS